MPREKPTLADVVGEDPALQRREWIVNRVGWAFMASLVIVALLGVFGKGPLSETEEAGAHGQLSVSYERFVRNLGQTTVEARFQAGSARDGTVRLAINADYMTDHEVMSMTPQPQSVTAEDGNYVYEFRAPSDTSLRVTFGLRPKSGMGVVHARISSDADTPVRFWQLVYP